jgi:hypothetical protein
MPAFLATPRPVCSRDYRVAFPMAPRLLSCNSELTTSAKVSHRRRGRPISPTSNSNCGRVGLKPFRLMGLSSLRSTRDWLRVTTFILAPPAIRELPRSCWLRLDNVRRSTPGRSARNASCAGPMQGPLQLARSGPLRAFPSNWIRRCHQIFLVATNCPRSRIHRQNP